MPKYLALLFDNLALNALLAGIVAGGATYVCQHWIDLPLNSVVTTEFEPFFEVTKYASPWEYLAAVLAMAATLLFLPTWLTQRKYFLDCLCIHQTDTTRKIEGIRNLGGFVAMSETLVIMWDECYFTRLWYGPRLP